MRKRRATLHKKVVTTSLVLLGCALVVIMGISYYAMCMLTFAGDRTVYGKRASDLMTEIREEILKRPGVTEVSFPTVDSYKLAGILVKRQNAVGNVVLCHGYRGGKELMYAFLEQFPDWNALMFDFRAHGQSSGSMTSIGCHEYKDVIAATMFLREQTQTHKHLPMVILGVSMGGASSLRAVEEEQGLCNALIVDSAYAHLGKTVLKAFSAKSVLPRYPFFPIMKQMFHYFAQCDVHSMNPAESVKSIKIPILFIHSCDDTYISPKNVLKLYAGAQHKHSKLWIGPRCRHGWLHSYHSELYKKKISRFLNRALSQ